jgi:hypothetical protein
MSFSGSGYSEHASREAWRRSAAEAAILKSPDARTNRLLGLVTGRAMAGMTEDGAHTVSFALCLDRTKPTLTSAVVAAALVNDKADALPLISRLSKDYPEDTLIQKVILPVSRAPLALAAHDPRCCIERSRAGQRVLPSGRVRLYLVAALPPRVEALGDPCKSAHLHLELSG